MGATDKRIGTGRCPLCGSKDAVVGVSAKRWAYVVCGACKCQVFARGEASDEAIRALIVQRAHPPAAAKPGIEPERTPEAKHAPPAAPATPTRGIFYAWGI
jgi:hypothetical protein